MFQALESPGKTKKGKHRINKENGSCQQESANHHTGEEKQLDITLSREVKPHPSDASIREKAGDHEQTGVAVGKLHESEFMQTSQHTGSFHDTERSAEGQGPC